MTTYICISDILTDPVVENAEQMLLFNHAVAPIYGMVKSWQNHRGAKAKFMAMVSDVGSEHLSGLTPK